MLPGFRLVVVWRRFIVSVGYRGVGGIPPTPLMRNGQ